MSNFLKATEIKRNEEDYRIGLDDALQTAQNVKTVSNRERRELRKNRASSVSAAIPASRLEWAIATSNAVQAKFGTQNLFHEPELFFVTLIDRDWLTSARSAVDLGAMKRKIRAMVGPNSSLFVIEPAYYANIQNDIFQNRAISWHVHGLMWGLDKNDMRTLVAGINGSSAYATMIPTRTPAHCRKIKQGDLPRHVGYIVKPPANAYRVFCLRKFQADKEREVGVPIDPIYEQRKQPLRPGERIRLFHALKAIDPSDLLIGGGDGHLLARQIRSQLR